MLLTVVDARLVSSPVIVEIDPVDSSLQAAVAAVPNRPALVTSAPTSPIAVLVRFDAMLDSEFSELTAPDAMLVTLLIAPTAPDAMLVTLLIELFTKDETPAMLSLALAPRSVSVCRPLDVNTRPKVAVMADVVAGLMIPADTRPL